jgi:hypothetical protein
MDYLSFTEIDILERVDEYALYCHYLGYHLTLGERYPAPAQLRHSNGLLADDNPSFSVFEKTKVGNIPTEFLWKDFGGKGYSGDIFELVKRLCDLPNRWDAIQRIASEFGFGAPWIASPVKELKLEKKKKEPRDIAVISKPWTMRELLYWDRGCVTKEILLNYDTSVVRGYFVTMNQRRPFTPKSMMFAYYVQGKYQLYSPYEPKGELKFINDWHELCVPGFKQLRRQSDTLIITKSMKDVLVLTAFGYEAIAVRSENVLLPPECIAHLKRHYKRILILFDNDGKHRGDEYEFPNIFIPKLIDTDKDPYDFCDNHGEDETRLMLKSIIYAS